MAPGSGTGKKSRSGSGMNMPDHISESLKVIFLGETLTFFDADLDPGIFLTRNPGSGMENIRIQGPQHWSHRVKKVRKNIIIQNGISMKSGQIATSGYGNGLTASFKKERNLISHIISQSQSPDTDPLSL
jgi:hypothetical protein